MRANDLATTAAMPLYFKAVTACSRELPLPQLRPATITSPGCASVAKLGSRSSSACAAISFGSFSEYVYLPGKITSVLTPSPYFQTRPVIVVGCWLLVVGRDISLILSFPMSLRQSLNLARIADHAPNRARSHHCRTGQINLRIGLTHAPFEVAV